MTNCWPCETARDLSGRELAALLHRHYGYEIARQTGSHLRLTTTVGGEHSVTVPAGGPLRVGTLAALLAEVAEHHGITRPELEDRLFR
jgi:predicted RNA binding protein YcfA (HicA-like mRNA interferase family)